MNAGVRTPNASGIHIFKESEQMNIFRRSLLRQPAISLH